MSAALGMQRFRVAKLEIIFHLTLSARKFSVVNGVFWTSVIAAQAERAVPIPLWTTLCISSQIVQWTQLDAKSAFDASIVDAEVTIRSKKKVE